MSEMEDNSDPIHDMRVSFKRLKILLQLLELISDSDLSAKDECQSFKKLYKVSGGLRDVHVQDQILATYIDQSGYAYDKYQEYLRQIIEKRNIKYQKSKEDFDTGFFLDLGEKCSRIINKSNEENIKIETRKLLAIKANLIRKAYHRKDDEKRFHEIRRYAKELQYLNNILDNKLPVENELNIKADRLAEIGQMLGSWHDKLTAESFLERFLSKFEDSIPDKEDYNNLLALIREEKNYEYQQLDKIFIEEIKIN